MTRGPRWRPLEATLLTVTAVVAQAAAAMPGLQASGHAAGADVRAAAYVLAGYAVLHVALCIGAPTADEVVVPIVALLGCLGLVLVRRLAPDFAAAELRWQLLAVVVIAGAVLGPLDTRLLARYRYSWLIGGIALVAVTIVFGRSAIDAAPGSPRLWLGAGPLRFQPSELMKLVLIVFLAGYVDDRRELLSGGGRRFGRWRLPPVPYLAPVGVMLGVSLALLVVQRDLGAALLLFAITLGMLYLATLRADVVVLALAAFAAGAAFLHRHASIVATRVAIWRDPWAFSQEAGYQLVQGLVAIASGGVIGTGIGRGDPGLVPAVHTDYIFAAVAEELGVAGATAVLALFGLLVWRGLRIALAAGRSFDALLAAGLAIAFAFQEAIIVGGNLRLIPLTGITLPFLSYGGSSLVICAASAGILVRISRTPAGDTAGLA